jgi:hypothetical protein
VGVVVPVVDRLPCVVLCIALVVGFLRDDVVADVDVAAKVNVFVVGVNRMVLEGLNPSVGGAAVKRNAAKQQTIVRLVDEIR